MKELGEQIHLVPLITRLYSGSNRSYRRKTSKLVINLTFWTNTIQLRPIRYVEVCKQVGNFEKGRERTCFWGIKGQHVLWANFYLSLRKPAFQLYVASGFADTHTPSFDLTKRVSPKPVCCICIQHVAQIMSEKKYADYAYCVILTHRTQTKGFVDVCGEVCQGIVEEILYWAFFKP